MDTVQETFLLGVSNELFLRSAMTIASVLLGFAVKHLSHISRDISDLKTRFAAQDEREKAQDDKLDSHASRLDRLENLETRTRRAD